MFVVNQAVLERITTANSLNLHQPMPTTLERLIVVVNNSKLCLGNQVEASHMLDEMGFINNEWRQIGLILKNIFWHLTSSVADDLLPGRASTLDPSLETPPGISGK